MIFVNTKIKYMKTGMLVVSCLAISTTLFAQKKELKEAEKLLANGKYAEAKAIITTLEPGAESLDSKLKPQFYYLKGQALAGKVDDTSVEDLQRASEAYQKVAAGSSKYKTQATNAMSEMSNSIVNSAVKDQNAEAFDKASAKLYTAYSMRKQDTSYLYFAASNAVNDKNYDNALKYYQELLDLNYDGSETQYTGVDKDGKEQLFADKAQRDLMVKAKELTDPADKTTPSKRGDIARMVALIYVEQGKDEEAIKAIDKAKAANPGDTSLLQTEANLYYKLGNIEKYKEIMESIVANDPDNPDLYYNLGVSAGQLGDNAKAAEYYKKAIALKPDYATAKLNLSSTLLANDPKIVEEMNTLGNTAADNKKFDELKAKRMKAYEEAVPYLESALEDEPENIAVVQTLMQIYGQMDNPKYDAMKEKLNKLKE